MRDLNGISAERELPYLRAAFVLCPSFTLTPMACFADALRLAADHHDHSRPIFFDWEYASVTDEPIASSSTLLVEPTIKLDEITDYDCIIVCGGLLREFDTISSRVFELLRSAQRRGTLVIGLCTGSFVLARAGLLDGGHCAIQANVLKDFTDLFPDIAPVTQRQFIIEDNVITCPGGVLALDVAALVIEMRGDASRTLKALDYLLFDYENPRSQLPKRPYQELFDRASDLTRDAVILMEANVDAPFSVSELALRLNTTRPRLNRQFARDMRAAPGAFWLELRLQIASRLMLERNLSVTEIGYSLGFADAAHFCRRFRQRFDVSPKRFREKFSVQTQ